MPHRKWEQARDGDYSCCRSPLREPMPSEPSRTGELDLDEDELDESVSAAAGVVGDCTAAGRSSTAWSSAKSAGMFSRNVADGMKNRFPVTARLKSSSRS